MNIESDIKRDVLERFLRYVRIDTQSDEHSDSFPSTARQLELLGLLAEELRGLGVEDVRQDEHGYVMATVPSTLPEDHRRQVPTVGFLAHVDTSPDAPAANVQPQVIDAYEGGPIVLAGDPSQTIDPAEMPALDGVVGHTLVTSDGTTLLGADDKAGVAEIMSAVTYLVAHPEIVHGPIAVAFTPDEEVGQGTKHFDIERFGAEFAYTIDGSEAGGIQRENFSADAAKIVVKGRAQHPGYAKGKMVNAIKLAAEIVTRLPRDRLSPETTEGHEGFVHPMRFRGTMDEATINLILRDFEASKLVEQHALLESIIADISAMDARAEITVTFSESYRNMRDALDEVPFTISHAEEAIRRVGLEPFSESIRGGTDGARLTAMGLPTPNLFTGGHNYHSRREWADVDTMVKATQTIVELAKVWAERGRE